MKRLRFKQKRRKEKHPSAVWRSRQGGIHDFASPPCDGFAFFGNGILPINKTQSTSKRHFYSTYFSEQIQEGKGYRVEKGIIPVYA